MFLSLLDLCVLGAVLGVTHVLAFRWGSKFRACQCGWKAAFMTLLARRERERLARDGDKCGYTGRESYCRPGTPSNN